MRPFFPGETDGQSVVDYIGENGDIMILNPHKKGKDARKVFSFNKVFGPNATQGNLSPNIALPLKSNELQLNFHSSAQNFALMLTISVYIVAYFCFYYCSSKLR